MLNKDQILRLFDLLNNELKGRGIRGDVFVVGGAAMTVAYNARPATRDVDAIFHPSSDIRNAAEAIAQIEGNIDVHWLNDGVKGFLPGSDEGDQKVIYENDFLTVRAASPRYLLATKLLASRVSRDEDDILFLYNLCGLTTVEEGLDLVQKHYGNRPIEAKVRFMLEELLSENL